MMLDLGNWLDDFLYLLRSPIGPLIFIPLYAFWVTLLLPGVWASMLAGALYGTWFGSLLVFLGAFVGAEVAFFLGRTLLRNWARNRMAKIPKFEAVEKAVSREGLKLVLLTRLSPAFPFGLLNFVYGLSEVSVIDYSVGLLAILPGTILFCGLGDFAGDLSSFSEVLSSRKDLGSYILTIVGLLSTFAVVWLSARAARRALQDLDTSL